MKAIQGQTVSVLGDRYTFLVTGKESGGAFAMFDFLVPPGHGPPPHEHSREDEAFHIIEGEFEFVLNGQAIRPTPGQCLYAKRGLPHSFRNIGAVAGRMVVVVAPSGLEEFFAEVGTTLPSANAEPIEPTRADIDNLLAAAARHGMTIHPPPN